MYLQRSGTVWLAPADTNKTRRVVFHLLFYSKPLLLHPPFSFPGWSLKVFSFYVTTSPNLPKWEKRRRQNWRLSEFPFSSTLSLAGRRQRKKTFAADSAALSPSVLQQNCWKPGVVFRNLASTQVKVSHSFNTECIVPNQEQSMEPQPPQGAKETGAKLQESRSAIILSHAQRRR